jgi:hypothetical protein
LTKAGLKPKIERMAAQKRLTSIKMKTSRKRAARPLAKGQLWQTKDSYVQIVELGKRLIHYKMPRELGQRAVKTHAVGIGTLESYLRTHAARLIAAPASAKS